MLKNNSTFKISTEDHTDNVGLLKANQCIFRKQGKGCFRYLYCLWDRRKPFVFKRVGSNEVNY